MGIYGKKTKTLIWKDVCNLSSQVRMPKLDHKEGWVWKNWIPIRNNTSEVRIFTFVHKWAYLHWNKVLFSFVIIFSNHTNNTFNRKNGNFLSNIAGFFFFFSPTSFFMLFSIPRVYSPLCQCILCYAINIACKKWD